MSNLKIDWYFMLKENIRIGRYPSYEEMKDKIIKSEGYGYITEEQMIELLALLDEKEGIVK